MKTLLFGLALATGLLFPSIPAFAANNQLTVVHNQVLTSTGQPFVPEGISVYGDLEAPDYKENTVNDYAQIKAAALYWHANTIRLQVAESNLFSRLHKHETYNYAFLSELEKQVSYAHSFGAAVVINDQTEFTDNEPSPTIETSHFWEIVATQFKSKPYVIFDIFNEPRLTSLANANFQTGPDTLYSLFGRSTLTASRGHANSFSNATSWRLWRDGGKVNGTRYLGMQTVVNQIRATGAHNLIWVEGTYGARRLPPNYYLLQGTNLVYAIHHPNLNRPASWQSIGSLAAIRPVVEGEWAQYQSNWAECFSKAYTNAPLYLAYLHAHDIGIIAWSLQANSLIKGDGRIKPTNLNKPYDPHQASDLKTPNRLTATYSCGKTHYGQGVGRLLQNYFAQNSTSYSL